MTFNPAIPNHEPGLRISTVLRLDGADSLDLLHRISTQSLVDLEPGRVRSTLFCDFRGRLLHRAAVAVTQDRSVWVLRDDAPGGELLGFIDRHLFREEVRLSDAGAGLEVRPVYGGVGLETGTMVERQGKPHHLQLDASFGLSIESGVGEAPDGSDELGRIRAGLPRHGHEVRDAFNPFEVGLAGEVHLSKGCFTGQEALMRMVTYRGVRRGLARVSGAGAVPPPGCEIRREDRRVGVVTSAVADGAGWIGLAVIERNSFAEAGLVAEGHPLEVPVPFPESKPLGLP